MNRSITKIFIAAFITLASFGKANSQTSDNSIHAFFKGNETEVKNNIKTNNLSFFVSGLTSDQEVAAFVKRSQPYAKGFTMTVGSLVNGERECKINFVGAPEMKWMLRFFLASSVKDVEQ